MIRRMEWSCPVPGCTRPFYARGLCGAHYILARKYPDDTPAELAARGRRVRTEDEVRALLLARSLPVGECREWQGARDRHGYGNVRWDGALWGAHRLAFHLFVQPVAKGAEVCHSCDNPPCILTDHLFLGTHHENMLDAASKGRMAGNGGRSGERNGRAVLSDADVLVIRESREPPAVLAARYGVSTQHVCSVRTGLRR